MYLIFFQIKYILDLHLIFTCLFFPPLSAHVQNQTSSIPFSLRTIPKKYWRNYSFCL